MVLGFLLSLVSYLMIKFSGSIITFHVVLNYFKFTDYNFKSMDLGFILTLISCLIIEFSGSILISSCNAHWFQVLIITILS